jgi:hypothetical protein
MGSEAAALLDGRWAAVTASAPTAATGRRHPYRRAGDCHRAHQEQSSADRQPPLLDTRDQGLRNSDRFAFPEIFFPVPLADHQNGKQEMAATCFEQATLDAGRIRSYEASERVRARGSEGDSDALSLCRIGGFQRSILVATNEGG